MLRPWSRLAYVQIWTGRARRLNGSQQLMQIHRIEVMPLAAIRRCQSMHLARAMCSTYTDSLATRANISLPFCLSVLVRMARQRRMHGITLMYIHASTHNIYNIFICIYTYTYIYIYIFIYLYIYIYVETTLSPTLLTENLEARPGSWESRHRDPESHSRRQTSNHAPWERGLARAIR